MWTPEPTITVPRRGVGWAPAGPPAVPRDPVRGWTTMPSATGLIDGHGPLDGFLDAAPTALADGYGTHQATLLPADGDVWDLAAVATGYGTEEVEIIAALTGTPITGLSGQIPGVLAAHLIGLVDGHGRLSGELADTQLAATASGNATLASTVVGGPLAGAAPWGAGGAVDGEIAVVPVTAVLHAFTTIGSHTLSIPPWVRYIDLVCLGGGGGGSTGNQINQEGYGGWGGVWAADTWDRGATRNLWTTLSITVGAGGGTQANGQASSAAISGVGTVTGAGGQGRSDNGSFLGDARNGQPAQGGNGSGSGQWQNLTYQGVTYVAGGPSTTDTANVPAAGGRGGGGTTWPLTPGSGRPGGRGQVWIRFWM